MDGSAADRIGQRRSRVATVSYEVPTDYPEDKIPHDRILAKWLDRKAKQGWQLERVIARYKAPEVALSKEKGACYLWLVDCLLSTAVREFTMWVPDKAVDKLLAHPRIGPLITKVS